jgi:apolipoprotein N-acyltransferase
VSPAADGRALGLYEKHHLFTFGEYLPLGDTFPSLYGLVGGNVGRLTSGTADDPLPLAPTGSEFSATALICYEDLLPAYVNRLVARADPALLVNLTNDVWFGNTLAPWQHLALSTFRAIEHRRFLVRSTNCGVSAVIDPTGRVVVHGATFRAETLEGTVRLMHGHTLYELLGETPWMLVALFVVAAAVLARKPTTAS